MVGKFRTWLSAGAIILATGAAHGADVTPLPRDWSGFYAGVHVGLGSGIESSLSTVSEYTTLVEDGGGGGGGGVTETLCWKEVGNGDIHFREPNKNGCPNGFNDPPYNPASAPIRPNQTEDFYKIVPTMDRVTSDDDLNFIAGLNAGYNLQHGAVVFGVEADISGLFDGEESLESSAAVEHASHAAKQVNGASLMTFAEGEFGLSHVGTLRARLGYDVDGTWLPFLTGGLAWGKVSTEGTATYDVHSNKLCAASDGCKMGPVTQRFGDSDYEMGWTLGAGVNYRVAENAFIGLTYLYADLGEHSFRDSYEDLHTGLIGSVEGDVDASFHSVRVSFDVMF